MNHIAILTTGLWRLRREVAALSAMTPVRWDTWPRPRIDAVAGWGHAPTTGRARRLAGRKGLPYIAFEDGPLRSVRPGPAQPPMSMVMDRSGIYYAAAAPSDLVEFAGDISWFSPAVAERAECALDQLRGLRLSKYNSGPERSPQQLGLSEARRRVLVLDQVRDDASIAGALADASCFADMLSAAVAENPEAEVVVKLHPDVMSGRRSGYFPGIAASGQLKVVAEPVNPWSLLDGVDTLYTVSSGMGFEAALAGKRVVTFGSPYYSGWGFTDDRRLKLQRAARLPPLQLFAAFYLRYAHYLDAYSRKPVSFEHAAEQLAWLRDRFHERTSRSVCYNIKRWKRGSVDRMLDGPAGPPLHQTAVAPAVDLARRSGGHVVAWASRDNSKLEDACRRAGVPLIRLEDGFVRSAGLGASFVPPLSLVFDRTGIYYDARAESDLEALLERAELPPALVDRGRRLCQALVSAGTTKYNVDFATAPRVESGGRPIILVPGQVEDDASIERGSPLVKRNVELLERVRERHPEAFVLYKPHPDVEAGFRRGHVPPKLAARYADAVVSRASILGLIDVCDRVETITSLAGFEALLRSKAVTTHGQPFYAGWGLTEDLCPVERRTRLRSIDELVAAALILYPRYVDPVTGLLCTPELLVDRLATAERRPRTGLQRIVRAAQVAAARALHLGHSVKVAARRGG